MRQCYNFMKGKWDPDQKRFAIFFFSDNTWSFKITKYSSKNWIILIQFITLGHCSAHWHLWGLLAFEIHSLSLLDDEEFLKIQNGILPARKSKTCMHSLTWSSGTLGTMCTIFRWCAKAPSHITNQILPLLPFSLCSEHSTGQEINKTKGEGRGGQRGGGAGGRSGGWSQWGGCSVQLW